MRCDRWFGSRSARHRRRGHRRLRRRHPHPRACAGGHGSHPSHSGTAFVPGDDPSTKDRERIRGGDPVPLYYGILGEICVSIQERMPSPRRVSGNRQSLAFKAGGR